MTAATTESGAFRRFWVRWRFHLSALMILAPLALAPHYFEREAMESGASGLGAREIGDKIIGPWTVRLAEFDVGPPEVQGPAGPIKELTLAMKGDAVTQVRAAFVKIGKPRSLRAAGAIFVGTPYRQTAGLAIPERTSPDAQVWITLEGWDGSVHQAPIALAEASPAAADWLRGKQGRKP